MGRHRIVVRSFALNSASVVVWFLAAAVASVGFISYASRLLADEDFAEVGFVWLTIGTAPAMLCLGANTLFQRQLTQREEAPTWWNLLETLAIPLFLCVVVFVVSFVWWVVTGSVLAAVVASLAPALVFEVVRTTASDGARVTLGAALAMLTSGQARVVYTVGLVVVLRAAGRPLDVVTVTASVTIVALVAMCGALWQVRPSIDRRGARGARLTLGLRDGRLAAMVALASASIAGVLFARAPLWLGSVGGETALDEIALGVTFYTLFSQPQAVSNLAVVRRIAESIKSADVEATKHVLRLTIMFNSALVTVALLVLLVAGPDLLELVFGERAAAAFGVLVVFSIAGAILSASGPGLMILQLVGRDRLIRRTSMMAIVAVLVFIPIASVLGAEMGIAITTLVIVAVYNMGLTWAAFQLGTPMDRAGSVPVATDARSAR